MTRFGLFFGALGAFVAADASGIEGSAQFRGYSAVNRVIRERIAKSPDFALGKNLTATAPAVDGLLGLLGTYSASRLDHRFRNGQPGTVSMMIWYLSLSDLAAEIGEHCARGSRPKLELRPEFQATLMTLCGWPRSSARQETVLKDFWRRLMAFDAPPEELERWRNHFLSPEYAKAPSGQVVPEMVLSALYNPYFLLRH